MSIFAPSYPLPADIGINKILETIRNPYCSVSDVERFLHRYDLDIGPSNSPEDYEDMVQHVIYEAEAEIDSLTMSTFHKTRRLEWHDGDTSSSMVLDICPIISVNTVSVYSPGFLTYNHYEGNFFVVDNEAGVVSFPTILYSQTALISKPLTAVSYAFLPGKKNIAFDYWCGWDTVPDSGYHAGIRFATAKLATSILLNEAEARQSQGLMSLNVTGQGAQYGRWSLYAQSLRQEAERAAARYRRQQIGGMWA